MAILADQDKNKRKGSAPGTVVKGAKKDKLSQPDESITKPEPKKQK